MNIENPRRPREVEQTNIQDDVGPILLEEVKLAIAKMKIGKAVGPDNIPADVWKHLGNVGAIFLQKIFNKIVTTGHMPDEWRSSTIVPIYKNKGDPQDCSNYRGIKLMSHTMKIWERVIDARLRAIVDIGEEQFGFISGRSTTDAIFSLRQTIEKHREGQENLHCVFIDLEKAYDRVPRDEVWNCLRIKGVSEKYVKLIQDMYQDSKAQVRCSNGLSEQFEVKVGVHQGSALSPLLFIIIMDCLTEDIRQTAPWEMMFADDVVLCTKTREEAERKLENWRSALEERGLKVSRKKTEYLCSGGGQKAEGTIHINYEEVPIE